MTKSTSPKQPVGSTTSKKATGTTEAGPASDTSAFTSTRTSTVMNRVFIVAIFAVIATVVGLELLQSRDGRSAGRTAPASGSPAAPAPTAMPPNAAGSSAGSAIVRANSHRLSVAPDGKVTFVEFLDFECEACGAAYPAIEELRQLYAGRVTFVVRYFPLDGHFNSVRAARAVEAAAQQGKFEPMYQKMFTTQSEWGEAQVAKDDVFRGFAVDLGLDMARWDIDYSSPVTLARVQGDLDDAKALGLTGTPSFFINETRLEPESLEDLTKALDEALAQ